MKDVYASDETGLDVTLQKICAKAVSSIMQNTDADTALLDILTKDIVTLSPNTDSVEQAVNSIKDLAKERSES